MAQRRKAEIMTSYEDRIKKQVEQYQHTETMHVNSSISDYYKEKYIRHKWRSIFSPARNHYEFYANQIIDDLRSTQSKVCLSVGSGDANIEIEVAKIIKTQLPDFFIELTELSEFQMERAKASVMREGLGDHFRFNMVDINNWAPSTSYAAVMAHHSLHHVVNLEKLFDGVKESLLGSFCTMDMIGRNGHMRWPETLEIIEHIWEILPKEKKFHNQLKITWEKFVNHDCSSEGFEGIRSQDILPLLIERFNFNKFFAFGGIIDPFVGRGFGQNYSRKEPLDKSLIDLIAFLNDLLIDLGRIKPTQMHAVMSKDNLNSITTSYGKLTPEFCIRDPKI
ncbi:hypothetical protein SAMN05421644_1117 [Allochromatium warmingii]|uniref:Methyltransferase domain-containing protein n=2 Tax=Allochromatium warmingii TaxID=61595 RepID=A0A1H3E2N2_ALLWA|nr:hypothetical protein SAMN05421644_1117 [Allochromatium warmingii]